MPPEAGELLQERDGRVVTLRLNRPRRRHALSLSLLQELERTIRVLQTDDSAHVVVIASSGPVFSSGHDLSEVADSDAAAHQDLFETCSRVMLGLRKLPQPVIARVQGLATAAGCQLVAACDLAIASSDAQFATPGVKIGLFCTTPMVPLVRSVPPKVAMEMLLTGQPVSADRACAMGLINQVVEADQLDDAVQHIVAQLLTSSRRTLALGKRAFYEQLALPEAQAYPLAVETMTRNMQLPDAKEGIQAFLEKRPPNWTP